MESEKAVPPPAAESPTEIVESAADQSVAGSGEVKSVRSGSRAAGFRRAKAVAMPTAAGSADTAAAVPAVPQGDTVPGDAVVSQAEAQSAPTTDLRADGPTSPAAAAAGAEPVSARRAMTARVRALAGRVSSSPAAVPVGGSDDRLDPSVTTASTVRRRRRLLPAVIVAAAVAAGVPVLLVQGSGEGTTRQASTVPLPVGPTTPGFGEELAGPPSPGESSSSFPTPGPTGGGAAGATPVSTHATGKTAPGISPAPRRSPSRYMSPSPNDGATSGTSPAAPSPSPTAAAVQGGLDYDAITGLGCKRDNSTQDYYTRGTGLSGWRTAGSGGFGGYGCSGKYESMPLNGTNTHSDNRYMVWWFATSKVSSANCDLWIYVPKAADAADTASTAHFAVIPSKDSGATIGTFTVNESAARGDWASSGRRWPMRDGKLAVKLTDRGSGRASAAAALVQCYKA